MDILWTILAMLYGLGVIWAWQVERNIGTPPASRVFLAICWPLLFLAMLFFRE